MPSQGGLPFPPPFYPPHPFQAFTPANSFMFQHPLGNFPGSQQQAFISPQTSAASGDQSDIEQAGKSGSRPEMEDVLDEEES